MRPCTMPCTPGLGAGQRSVKRCPSLDTADRTLCFSEGVMLAVVRDAFFCPITVCQDGMPNNLWHCYGKLAWQQGSGAGAPHNQFTARSRPRAGPAEMRTQTPVWCGNSRWLIRQKKRLHLAISTACVLHM